MACTTKNPTASPGETCTEKHICTKRQKLEPQFFDMCITSFPSPPQIPTEESSAEFDEHLLAMTKKYKYNWRLTQLAKPRYQGKKYEYEPPKPVSPIVLSNEIEYYANQISRPPIRILVANRQLFAFKGKKYVNKMDKFIEYSYNSIYNYYKAKLRDRIRRQMRLKALERKKKGKGDSAQKLKDNIDYLEKLAVPKKIHEPPKDAKPKKIFNNYDHLYDLSTPKPFVEETPKRVGVNPACLKYEATEIIKLLAQLPKHWLNIPKPLTPGVVKKGALLYQITPRVEHLALPKAKKEKAADETGEGWTISVNALNYKATPRIIELAKPVERD